MDPNATWAIVTDETADLDTRGQAAVDLLAWLAFDGRWQPAPGDNTRRSEVIDQCKTVLARVLDAAQAVDA